jgi:hypothetical protein
MSKITNVRLPNASPAYDASQFNQLVRSLEQIVLQLNSTYTPIPSENTAGASAWAAMGSGAGGGFAGGIRGFQNSNGIILPQAMMISDQDQTNASITAENLLTVCSCVFQRHHRGKRLTDQGPLCWPVPGDLYVAGDKPQ